MMALRRKDSESQTSPLGEIMTVEDIARYLVCVPSTIYRLIHNAQIPAFRFLGDSAGRISING
jgi:excisionase family DNA binding protein